MCIEILLVHIELIKSDKDSFFKRTEPFERKNKK